MTDADAIPQRSALIDLAPIGVGTRQAESMDGYLWRLACAHDVSTSAMKTFILYGESMTHTRFLARRADCPSVTGVRIAERLPGLTRQPDTARLGVGRLYGRLGTNYTIRANRCWCPQCITEAKASVLYLPLAWSLEGYSYCAKHARRMTTACPGCDRRFPSNAEWLPVDELCPHCGTQVCEDSERAMSMSPLDQATKSEMAVSSVLEDFCLQCGDIPNLVADDGQNAMKRAIAEALKAGAASSEQELAGAIGLTPTFLDRFRGDSAALPNLCVLSRLSVISGISMAGILFEPLWCKSSVQLEAAELQTLPLAHGATYKSYEPMIRAAREAIAAGQGIRIEQLARQVGVGEAVLRAGIGPELTAQLKQSAARHRRDSRQREFDRLVSDMKDTYLRLKIEGACLSAANVARQMGRFGEHDWFTRAYRTVKSMTF